MRNLLLKIIYAATALVLLLCTEDSSAAPATKKEFYLYQPDGTQVKARLTGDEFMRILTTADGYTIKQGPDKWYYYACYGEDGTLTLTEYRAGQDAPSGIKGGRPYSKTSAIKERSFELNDLMPAFCYQCVHVLKRDVDAVIIAQRMAVN